MYKKKEDFIDRIETVDGEKTPRELLEYFRGSKYSGTYSFRYAEHVYSGDVYTCIEQRQIVYRYLVDLYKSEVVLYRYHFDVDRAGHIITHSKKSMEPNENIPFSPALWQGFVLENIQAWLDKSTGYRKYREIFMTVPRRMGKSWLTGITASYNWIYDKFPRNQRRVLLSADLKEGAQSILDVTKGIYEQMIEESKEKEKKSGKRNVNAFHKKVSILDEEIRIKDKKENYIKILASEHKSYNGKNPMFAVLDEYADVRNAGPLVTSMEAAASSVPTSMTVKVGTASYDLTNVMFSDLKKYREVLSREDYSEEFERVFIFISNIEDIDEFYDESKWEKANLNIGDVDEKISSEALERVRGVIKKGMVGENSELLIPKYMNYWLTGNEDTYIDYGIWEELGLKKKPVLSGRDVYIGVDLSKTGDLTSVSFITEFEDFDYVDNVSFVSTKGMTLDRRSQRDSYDFEKGIREGCIYSFEDEINYDSVAERINEYIIKNGLNFRKMYIDPAMSELFLEAIENSGYFHGKSIEIVGQTSQQFSPYINSFRHTVYSGGKRIRHGDNSILNYYIKNAVLDSNKEVMKVVKKSKKSTFRIDGVISTILAFIGPHERNILERRRKRRGNVSDRIKKGVFTVF